MTRTQLLQALSWELTNIAKGNAPVRDPFYTAPNGKQYKTYSKYGQPGNLKNKGIVTKLLSRSSYTDIGGNPAPYAKYTEYTSRKKGWMQKSKNDFINRLIVAYGAKRK